MKVAVVGAGIAGLHAAIALKERGCEVTVFEARDRAGGRLKTLGGYEAGGEWIDADHRRCLQSLREYCIEVARIEGEYRVFRNGQVSHGPDRDMIASKKAVDLAAARLTSDPDPSFDEVTLADFVAEHASDPWWPTVYYRSDEGDDLDRIGLLGWLRGFRHYLTRGKHDASAFRVVGGMTEWVDRLSCSLAGRLRLRHVLPAVIRSGDQVWLDFGSEALAFDRVLLTLPPRCVEQVSFDPELSPEKRAAIAGCRMSRAIKIALIYQRPWWEDVDWSGLLFVDSDLQQVWPALEGPVLCAYICGEAAERFLARPDPVRDAGDEVERLVPGGRALLRAATVHDWLGDPFSRGAFSHLAPGYVLGPMKHIATPEGRIHFAGEHTAEWNGFIEGAIESAERAVEEIAGG
jgi:monoamine oxidase